MVAVVNLVMKNRKNHIESDITVLQTCRPSVSAPDSVEDVPVVCNLLFSICGLFVPPPINSPMFLVRITG